MIRLLLAIVAIYGFHEFISCEAQPYGKFYGFDGYQFQPYQADVNSLPKPQPYSNIRFLLRTISELRKNRIERSKLIPHFQTQFGNTVVQLLPHVPRSRYILPFFGHGNEIRPAKLMMNNFRNKPYRYRKNSWNDLVLQALKMRRHKSRNGLHFGAPNYQQINPINGLRQVKQYQPIVLHGIFFFGNPEVPKLAVDLLSNSKPVVQERPAIATDTFGSPENQPVLKGEAYGTSDEEDTLSTTVSTVNSEVFEPEEQEVPTNNFKLLGKPHLIVPSIFDLLEDHRPKETDYGTNEEEDTFSTTVPTKTLEGFEKPELVELGKQSILLKLLKKFKVLLQRKLSLGLSKKLPILAGTQHKITEEEDMFPPNVPTEQPEGLEKPELVDSVKGLNLLRKFKALLQQKHLMSPNKKLPKKHSILECILSIISEITEAEDALPTTVSTTNDLDLPRKSEEVLKQKPSSFFPNIIVPQKYPDSENTVYGTTEEEYYGTTEEEDHTFVTDSTAQSEDLSTPEPDRPKIPAIDFLDKFKSMLQPKPFLIIPNTTEFSEQRQDLNSTEYETTVKESKLSTTVSTTESKVSPNSGQNLITKMASNDVSINLPVTKISENINTPTPLPFFTKLKIATEALYSFTATTKLESDVSEVTVTAIPTARVYTNYQTTDNVAEISSNTTNQPDEPSVETNYEDGLKSKETKRRKRDTIDTSAADAVLVDTFGQPSLLQVAIQECDEGFMRKTLKLLAANLPSFIDQYILSGALEKFSSRCNSDNSSYKSYSVGADE